MPRTGRGRAGHTDRVRDETPGGERPGADEVDAVMVTAQLLVGITAQSVAAVGSEVTLPQLRVLVMVASRGPLNLQAVAIGLGVHPSNATRACDRLDCAGLLSRRDDPADRRNVVLELTDAGHDLVARVMGIRRAAVEELLGRMAPRDRRALVPLLRSFVETGGEVVPESGAWTLGWTTSRGS